MPKKPPCPSGNFIKMNDGRRKRRADSISGPPESSPSSSSPSSSPSQSPDQEVTLDNRLPPPSPTMRQDMQRLQNLTIRSPVITMPRATYTAAPSSPRPFSIGQGSSIAVSSPLPAIKPSPLSVHSPGCNSSFSPYMR
eukprot:5879400-Ditylum_brightwellii.AAC.1